MRIIQINQLITGLILLQMCMAVFSQEMLDEYTIPGIVQGFEVLCKQDKQNNKLLCKKDEESTNIKFKTRSLDRQLKGIIDGTGHSCIIDGTGYICGDNSMME